MSDRVVVRRVSCNYCKRDITRSLTFTDAECEDFKLCADCFSSGVELYPHKNTHKYKVSQCLEIPLFTKDWTINEELALLDGIEKHGCGNWKTISEFIGTGKTIQAVEKHYWELYMGVHGYCLPPTVLGEDNKPTISTESLCPPGADGVEEKEYTSAGGAGGDLYRIGVNPGNARGDPVRRDEGQAQARTGSNKDKQELKEKLAMLPGSDLPGYYPLRGDFDHEYENDSEQKLAEMEFSHDEHPSEKEMKLQIIEIYNHRLQERNRRKDFVIDRGLIDFKQQQQTDRKRSKEDREMLGKLRVFARYHSREEHEALEEGLLRARRLRQQIDLYKTYRQMGVRTMEQARQYEANKRIRERDLKARKHRESAPYLFQNNSQTSSSSSSQQLSEAGVDSLLNLSNNSGAAGAGGNARLTGRRRGRESSSNNLSAAEDIVDDSAGMVATAGANGRRGGRKSARSSSNNDLASSSAAAVGGSGDSSGGGGGVNTAADASSSSLSNQNDGQGRMSMTAVMTASGSVVVGGGGVSASSAGVLTEDPAVIKKAPGGDLLSEMEINLCAAVPMMPLHYMAAKDALVREAYRSGQLTSEGVKRLLKMDADVTEKIHDFFVKEMMINDSSKMLGYSC